MRILTKPIQFFAEPDDSGGEVKTEPKAKNLEDFTKRFSASKNAPPELGGDVLSDKNKKVVETAREDTEGDEQEREEDKAKGEEIKGRVEEKTKKPFIRQQIDAKKKAETERDEFKTKAAELEEKVKTYDARVAELQAKIDSGDYSERKEKEFQDRIQDLESKSIEERESLVNENKKLKDRVRFQDLANDEDFQKEYLAPVVEAHQSAIGLIESDPKKMQAFQQALIANAGALRAKTAEEKLQFEKQRNSILSSILEDLDTFSQGQFTAAANAYITRAHKHAMALMEGERTAAEIQERVRTQRDRTYAERMDSWGKNYKTTMDTYKDIVELSEEDKKIAQELKFDIEGDLKKSDHVASQTIAGQADMPAAIDLVHRGRVFPAMKVKLAIRDKQLKDAMETIKRLRGGGTGGGESTNNVTAKDEKPTREEWQKKFSANRIR